MNRTGRHLPSGWISPLSPASTIGFVEGRWGSAIARGHAPRRGRSARRLDHRRRVIRRGRDRVVCVMQRRTNDRHGRRNRRHQRHRSVRGDGGVDGRGGRRLGRSAVDGLHHPGIFRLDGRLHGRGARLGLACRREKCRREGQHSRAAETQPRLWDDAREGGVGQRVRAERTGRFVCANVAVAAPARNQR